MTLRITRLRHVWRGSLETRIKRAHHQIVFVSSPHTRLDVFIVARSTLSLCSTKIFSCPVATCLHTCDTHIRNLAVASSSSGKQLPRNDGERYSYGRLMILDAMV